MSAPWAIACQRVEAAYGPRTVLHGVEWRVEAGSICGLVGPNGAGKSTLFRVVTGLRPPRQGEVTVFGWAIRRLPANDRAGLVGVVPQEIAVPVPFSVRQFVLLGRTARINRWRGPTRRDWEAVEEAMEWTDTLALADRPVTELSGGERQRAVVAMVLAQDPRLILLDEPTSHLDVQHQVALIQIVRRINRERGTTIVLISHDLNLMANVCPRLVLMDHGRVVADGPPSDVLTEDRLRQVYHCTIRVRQDPESGALALFPLFA